jgi:hypothetical protein
VNCASGLGVRRAIVFLLVSTKASISTLTYTRCQGEFSVQRKKERFAFTRKARKCLISSIRCSFLPKALAISRGASALSERQLLLTRTTTRNLVIDTRDVKEERTESWFIKQSMTIEILP